MISVYSIPGMESIFYPMKLYVKPAIIQQVVCEVFMLQNIFIKTRKRDLVKARYVYFWFCRKYTKMTLHRMVMGTGLDHATALHGIRDIDAMITTKDKFYYPLICECEKHIRLTIAESLPKK